MRASFPARVLALLGLLAAGCAGQPEARSVLLSPASPAPAASATHSTTPASAVNPGAGSPATPLAETGGQVSVFLPTVEAGTDPAPARNDLTVERTLCSPLAELPKAWLVEIVSQPFSSPRPGRDDAHPGLDLAFYRWRGYEDIRNWPVQTVLPGTVLLAAEDRPPYGNFVLIETPAADVPPAAADWLHLLPGQAVYSLYAHLAEPSNLEHGDPVTCGEQLGLVGSTGYSGAPHLHLEIRVGEADASLSGMAYYDTRTTELERQNYRRWRMEGEFLPIDPIEFLSLETGEE